MSKVRADKLREVRDGHDGTWVAHPGLIPIAKAVFDEHMPGSNQLDRQRDDVHVTQADLLKVRRGSEGLERTHPTCRACARTGSRDSPRGGYTVPSACTELLWEPVYSTACPPVCPKVPPAD